MLSNCRLLKTLESSLNTKGIKPVHLKGNQSWIFFGRAHAEDEAPILWPPDVKSQLNGKGPDAGKDWGKEEKGATKDEMVGWHDRLHGHEFELTLEIVKDREDWCAAVHVVAKSGTWLSDWTTPLYTDWLGASPGEWHLSWIIRETAMGSSEGRAFQAEGRARERSLG